MREKKTQSNRGKLNTGGHNQGKERTVNISKKKTPETNPVMQKQEVTN